MASAAAAAISSALTAGRSTPAKSEGRAPSSQRHGAATELKTMRMGANMSHNGIGTFPAYLVPLTALGWSTNMPESAPTTLAHCFASAAAASLPCRYPEIKPHLGMVALSRTTRGTFSCAAACKILMLVVPFISMARSFPSFLKISVHGASPMVITTARAPFMNCPYVSGFRASTPLCCVTPSGSGPPAPGPSERPRLSTGLKRRRASSRQIAVPTMPRPPKTRRLPLCAAMAKQCLRELQLQAGGGQLLCA
mmetsp:Transcript_158550/g.279976  ORF Transcript_158550/g.279976 Transcript_158550/m.279976 type:complete len:252 (-) Transcript_158550:7-762(-)